MAYIALIACFAFTFWVLRKDLRFQPVVSSSLWVPTLWMMRCSSRSINYWLSGRGVGVQDSSTSDLGDQIFMAALILAGLVLLLRRRCNWSELIQNNVWIFVFFAYIGLSCVWAPDPFVSCKRCIRTYGDFMMALLVVTEAEPMQALFTVIRRTAIFFIPFSLLFCKFFPKYGRIGSKNWEPDMWVGVSTHKNELTAFLMLAAFYFIWNMVRARREGTPLLKLAGPRWMSLDLACLIMAAYMMLIRYSRSATALTCLVAGCALLLIFEKTGADKRRFWSWTFRIALVYIVVQGVCLIFTGDSVSDLLLELQGKQANLTGRTEYWPILIDFGCKHPILGAGYGGFWTASMMNHFLEISIWGGLPEAHNGYIETFLNLGLVGLGLLLLIVTKALLAAWRTLSSDFEYGRVRLILLIMILLHNFTEASFPRENHALWLVFLMIAFTVAPVSSSADVMGEEADIEPHNSPSGLPAFSIVQIRKFEKALLPGGVIVISIFRKSKFWSCNNRCARLVRRHFERNHCNFVDAVRLVCIRARLRWELLADKPH